MPSHPAESKPTLGVFVTPLSRRGAQGVFSNVTSPSTKAKLRILFEVAPLGLLVEKAGGQSSADGKQQSVRAWPLRMTCALQAAFG